jgi:hypothetical protein
MKGAKIEINMKDCEGCEMKVTKTEIKVKAREKLC